MPYQTSSNDTEEYKCQDNPPQLLNIFHFRFLSIGALVSLMVIELSVILWLNYDHSIPCWDTAAHRINSLTIYDLLQNPLPQHLSWWQDIFGVSPLYPPLIYLINGSLKLVLGRHADTEALVNLLFVALMFVATYYGAYFSCNKKGTPLIAAVLVFLYPWVYWSTHNVLLDCSANAMVAVALCLFLWWDIKPLTWKSVFLGITFGLTALTKNNTPLFLAGPILISAILSVTQRDFKRLCQTGLIVLFAGFTVLPWLILAGAKVSDYISSIQQQDFGISERLTNLLQNFSTFAFHDLPMILSPLLFICLIISIANPIYFNRKKAYLLASIIFSICLASVFRWPHQLRYIVPAAIPIAILTSDMFASLWEKKLWSKKELALQAILILILSISIFQLLYSAFIPYPLALPQSLLKPADKVMTFLGVSNLITNENHNPQGISFLPLPRADWGAFWVLSIIAKESHGKSTKLMIMPNTDTVSCSPYIYLEKLNNQHINNIMCLNGRDYTVNGDLVHFDPTYARTINWYVLKTGQQGIPLSDQASKEAYAQWHEFVRSSGEFRLAGKRQLPDNSLLELYRRRHSCS